MVKKPAAVRWRAFLCKLGLAGISYLMLPYRRFPLRHMLPSWWMAVWFSMLWSFCVSLFPESEIQSSCGIQWPIHEGGLCEGGIIGLTMPSLKPRVGARQFLQELPYLSLNKARCWQTIGFTGNGINDFICLDNARQYIQALTSDSGQGAGIRLAFRPEASYACFMEVLNMLDVWGEPKNYWLDVRHNPMKIYVIACPPEPTVN
jgi:hypothetical protein